MKLLGFFLVEKRTKFLLLLSKSLFEPHKESTWRCDYYRPTQYFSQLLEEDFGLGQISRNARGDKTSGGFQTSLTLYILNLI